MGLKQLEDVTYFRLNNEINRPVNGQIMLHKDKEALEAFFKENGYEDFVDLMIDGDLTEIEGADNLFKAESILLETMNRYKAMYAAKQAFMLVGGSSA